MSLTSCWQCELDIPHVCYEGIPDARWGMTDEALATLEGAQRHGFMLTPEQQRRWQGDQTRPTRLAAPDSAANARSSRPAPTREPGCGARRRTARKKRGSR